MANENLYWTGAARRHIRDSGTPGYGPAHNADQVAYDNGDSELDATDVQAAIDEVAGSVDAISGAEAAANTYTDNAISALVGDAPDLMNTLEEIAAALNDDEAIATTLLNAIAEKADDDHTHTLAELTDVDVATVAPAAGQTLVWDAANSVWVPGASGGGKLVRSDWDAPASYIGVADVGAGEDDEAWKITRITVSGSTVTTAQAVGVAWDNRLTETYA